VWLKNKPLLVVVKDLPLRRLFIALAVNKKLLVVLSSQIINHFMLNALNVLVVLNLFKVM